MDGGASAKVVNATRRDSPISKSAGEALLDQELIEDKLKLNGWSSSANGTNSAPELRDEFSQRLAKLFRRMQKKATAKTSAEFYDKLHDWLERKLPPQESLLHPRRGAPTRTIRPKIGIHWSSLIERIAASRLGPHDILDGDLVGIALRRFAKDYVQTKGDGNDESEEHFGILFGLAVLITILLAGTS